MATVTATRTTGKVTLTGTTVDTVTLAGGGAELFDVVNWSGATDLTVTATNDGTTPTTPVAGAAETWTIPAGQWLTISLPRRTGGNSTVVKVLGNGNVYSVERRSA